MTVQFLLRYVYIPPVTLLGVGMALGQLSTVVGPLVVQFRNWSPTTAVSMHAFMTVHVVTTAHVHNGYREHY